MSNRCPSLATGVDHPSSVLSGGTGKGGSDKRGKALMGGGDDGCSEGDSGDFGLGICFSGWSSGINFGSTCEAGAS